VARITLIRHGRAAAGWDDDPDPPLDDLGRKQAIGLVARMAGRGPVPIVSSPLLRCQQTAEPIAVHWSVTPTIDERVREIPSPEGVPMDQRTPWLRETMSGTWRALGPRYTDYRDGVVAAVVGFDTDTVVTSHFIAINAVIGACINNDRVVIRSLDNCSITVVESTPNGLVLVEAGHEADTLIR
jgi:broad specificity phosphatase PhoE